MESPNALLKDLAREREERSNSSLKRQRQATDTCDGGGSSGSQPASSSSLATGEGEARVIVDLCDSDDDGAAEDPSLALARRLQAEEDLQHSRLRSPGISDQAYQASSSDPWPGNDDAALAERLQREEMAKLMGRRGRLVSLAPGSDAWYEAMTRDENRRRVSCEGPPPPPGAQRTLHTYSSGDEQRLQGGGRVWSRANPCVVCDAEAVRTTLRDLGPPSGGGQAADIASPANLPLLQLLCAWRQHVRDTIMERREAGATKWKRFSICTSELTFLGRATAKGGVIGLVAASPHQVDSMEKLIALFPRDGRKRPGCGLSPFFALLIALYMGWPVGECAEARRAWLALNAKVKDTRPGIEASPHGMANALVAEGKRIPDRLQHLLLSRAHFP